MVSVSEKVNDVVSKLLNCKAAWFCFMEMMISKSPRLYLLAKAASAKAAVTFTLTVLCNSCLGNSMLATLNNYESTVPFVSTFVRSLEKSLGKVWNVFS